MKKSSSTIKITEAYFWPERNEQPHSVPASEQKKEGALVSGPCGAGAGSAILGRVHGGLRLPRLWGACVGLGRHRDGRVWVKYPL